MTLPSLKASISSNIMTQLLNWITNQNSTILLRIKISLSSSQILVLHTTPITCIPAPGAGYFNRIICASSSYVENANDYSGGTIVMSCDPSDANVEQYSTTTNFLANAGDNKNAHQYMYLQPITGGASDNIIKENTAIYAYVPGSNPTGGDSTVDLYITYEVIAL